MSRTTATRERPIIFTAESVRAILAGRKTQTRRMVKPQPTNGMVLWSSDDYRWYDADCINPGKLIREQYGEPGDRLWVKEAWSIHDDDGTQRGIVYEADPEDAPLEWVECGEQFEVVGGLGFGKWNPDRKRISPMFMPRWASRLTLEITGVRVERVQDISEADAIAEGQSVPAQSGDERDADNDRGATRHRRAFAVAWNKINGKRPGCHWRDNPWVWALTFALAPAALTPAPAGKGGRIP